MMLSPSRPTTMPTWPLPLPRSITAMDPTTGSSLFSPHFFQDRAAALLVPSYPACFIVQLTKDEHQGVSSLVALSLVDPWYSTIRGLCPLPAISFWPTSWRATSSQG